MLLIVAGLAAAFLIGAAIFLAAAGGQHADGGARYVLAALVAAVGAGSAALAWWAHRRLRPAPARHLSLSTDRDELKRGETIQVTLAVTSPSGERDRHREIGLVCTQWYRPYDRAYSLVQRTLHEQWHALDPALPIQIRELAVPLDAPCSREADDGWWAWRVSAREVRSGRPDARVDHPIWVLP